MAAVGGSLESVSLDGRTFAVPADSDVNRKLGGTENEVMANGDGTARLIKTRVNWSLDGLTVSIDDILEDQEFLQGLADRNDFFPVVLVYASGEAYQGNGQLTGEMQASSQSTTASISLMGTGALTKQ